MNGIQMELEQMLVYKFSDRFVDIREGELPMGRVRMSTEFVICDWWIRDSIFLAILIEWFLDVKFMQFHEERQLYDHRSFIAASNKLLRDPMKMAYNTPDDI